MPLLLHVGDFAVHKRDLQVRVDVDCLRTEIHDVVRLAKNGDDIINGLPELDFLRLFLLRRLVVLVLPLLLLGLRLRDLPALYPTLELDRSWTEFLGQM
jgi:hypothetical protein